MAITPLSLDYFFFTVAPPTEIYTLSLHDALPISQPDQRKPGDRQGRQPHRPLPREGGEPRSEEHTSELQSRGQLVCRLLLEKKKNIVYQNLIYRSPET